MPFPFYVLPNQAGVLVRRRSVHHAQWRFEQPKIDLELPALVVQVIHHSRPECRQAGFAQHLVGTEHQPPFGRNALQDAARCRRFSTQLVENQFHL